MLGEHRQFEKNLRKNKVPGEKLFEIEPAAKWYPKKLKETPLDRALSKMKKYLLDNALIADPFNKGVCFCVMKKGTYAEKLENVIDCE